MKLKRKQIGTKLTFDEYGMISSEPMYQEVLEDSFFMKLVKDPWTYIEATAIGFCLTSLWNETEKPAIIRLTIATVFLVWGMYRSIAKKIT